MNGDFTGEKILVTGGTGFLGGAVLDELILRGAQPFAAARKPPPEFLEKYRDKIVPIAIDLLDQPGLRQVLKTLQPDKIVHLAGVSGRKTNGNDSLEKINFEAAARLLELAHETRVERIIIIGTADEYGFQTAPLSERLPTEPVSDYAVSKNKAVKYALALHEKYRLPVVILRPFTVYGSGQPPSMFVSQAVECAVKNVVFEMSKGIQKRDLVFVTDFADAMMRALKTENIEGEIFNVGSGEAIALRDLAEKIWNLAGADLDRLKIGARQTNRNELHDTRADISKIKKTMGWKPEISIDEGLKNVIESRRTVEHNKK